MNASRAGWRAPLTGPIAATGQRRRTRVSVGADRFNTLGVGNAALVNGRLHQPRVPYPVGVFTKSVDGWTDGPNIGWRGEGTLQLIVQPPSTTIVWPTM